MEKLKIALVQMQSIVGAIDDNLAKMKNFILQAAEAQVDIICFPELSVTGYCNKTAVNFQEEIPGKSSNYLSQLAKEYGLMILAGICETSGEEKPFISQVLFLPDGEMVTYRKTHLGVSERQYFKQGDAFLDFAADKAHLGVELCWEMHFPEVTTILTLKGVEVIFVPHASPVIAGDRKKVWLKYMSTRAYDNCVFIAACNALGENGCGTTFSGGAMVIGPKGEIVAQDDALEPSMLVAELDPERLNRVRYGQRQSMRDSFYLNYRRPELYADLLKAKKI